MTPMGSAPLAWGSSRGEGSSRSECRGAALPGSRWFQGQPSPGRNPTFRAAPPSPAALYLGCGSATQDARFTLDPLGSSFQTMTRKRVTPRGVRGSPGWEPHVSPLSSIPTVCCDWRDYPDRLAAFRPARFQGRSSQDSCRPGVRLPGAPPPPQGALLLQHPRSLSPAHHPSPQHPSSPVLPSIPPLHTSPPLRCGLWTITSGPPGCPLMCR